MKKIALFVSLMLLIGAASGVSRSVIDPEDLSIKAGPTEPAEEISMVWLESFVYPKVVKEDRVISLGVRLTSKAKAVEASFDFNKDKFSLSSYDGMSWSGAYKIPKDVPTGLHIVRYDIRKDKGSIQRTVEFFLKKPVGLVKREENVSRGEVVYTGGWPLTVASTCAALVGGGSRILYSGQRVIGLSKVPWYKVIFEDGEEGWIPAAKVKEPLEEYFQSGCEAYRKKEYLEAIEFFKNTITIDPELVKGYLWLAKSYYYYNDYESAYRALREAMRLDERDIECKVVASSLAQKYFKTAHVKFKAKRFHEAIAAYQKVIELKPSSILSWIELGKSYESLGFKKEAQTAWREALKLDPNNKQVYALLGIDLGSDAFTGATEEDKQESAKAEAETVSKPSEDLLPILADDSLAIVKEGKTKKGTGITSALKSVIALTKSLGTPVLEKGWEIKKKGDKYLVRYLCEQGRGVLETFEWLVDIDTKQISAQNSNAKLLMERW